MQTGANISQLFLSASGFLHQFFFVDEASFRKELLIVSGQRRYNAAKVRVKFVGGNRPGITRRRVAPRIPPSDG